jgi:hypothetical protein
VPRLAGQDPTRNVPSRGVAFASLGEPAHAVPRQPPCSPTFSDRSAPQSWYPLWKKGRSLPVCPIPDAGTNGVPDRGVRCCLSVLPERAMRHSLRRRRLLTLRQSSSPCSLANSSSFAHVGTIFCECPLERLELGYGGMRREMTFGSAVVSSCAANLRAFPVYSRAVLIERLPGQFQIVAGNIQRLVECLWHRLGLRIRNSYTRNFPKTGTLVN